MLSILYLWIFFFCVYYLSFPLSNFDIILIFQMILFHILRKKGKLKKKKKLKISLKEHYLEGKPNDFKSDLE